MKRVLAFAVAFTLSAGSIRPPRERAFSFEYAVTVKDLPLDAKAVDGVKYTQFDTTYSYKDR